VVAAGNHSMVALPMRYLCNYWIHAGAAAIIMLTHLEKLQDSGVQSCAAVMFSAPFLLPKIRGMDAGKAKMQTKEFCLVELACQPWPFERISPICRGLENPIFVTGTETVMAPFSLL
jgi:hypothetical protein